MKYFKVKACKGYSLSIIFIAAKDLEEAKATLKRSFGNEDEFNFHTFRDYSFEEINIKVKKPCILFSAAYCE